MGKQHRYTYVVSGPSRLRTVELFKNGSPLYLYTFKSQFGLGWFKMKRKVRELEWVYKAVAA